MSLSKILRQRAASRQKSRQRSSQAFQRRFGSRSLGIESLEDRRVLAAWQPVGPSPIVNGQVEHIGSNNAVIGAVHAVEPHPTNANILYIGAVNGGVWKTTNATAANPTWIPLTDGTSSLSTGDLEMDPTDPDRLLLGVGRSSSYQRIGGELSGLTLIENGGATIREIDDPIFANQNVTAVYIKGNLLLAGTTDDRYFGLIRGADAGLYRSVDGGLTWSTVAGIRGGVFDLVADPSDATGNRLYAAVAGVGIFTTDDAGVTWTNVSLNDTGPFSLSQTITDERFPNGTFLNNNNTEMAVGNDGRLFAAVMRNGQLAWIGFTDTQGSAWTAMDIPTTPGADESLPDFLQPRQQAGSQGQIHFSIAVDPTNSDIVYVGGDRQNNIDQFSSGNFIGATDFSGRLFRGDASRFASRFVATEEIINEFITPPDGLLETFCNTFSNLCDVPGDPLMPLFYYQDTPSPQWSHITHSDNVTSIPLGGTARDSAPHADSRDLDFNALGELIEGDDGGVYKRTSPKSFRGDWFSLNGNLQITEFHDIAYDSNANIYIGGAQDVGTPEQLSSGSTTWASVDVQGGGLLGVEDFRLNADGGDVVVDDTSSPGRSYRYSSSQNLGLLRRQVFDSSNRLVSQTFLQLPAPAGGQFVTPLALNKINQRRLIVISNSGVYESVNRGDTFSLIPGLLDTLIEGGQNAIAYGGSLGGVTNQGVLYIGVRDEVYIRLTGLDNLEISRSQFPGGTVRDIVLDPTDWATAFVAGSQGTFVTRDAGGSWTEVTGNLGATSVWSLEVIPTAAGNAILAGTTAGIYAMPQSNPGVWSRFGTGLPNVLVMDMEYDATDNILVAGTMGRGAWSITSASAAISASVTSPPVTPPANTTVISGVVFSDINGDGIRQASEPGLSNYFVFVDVNGNGSPGIGEPSSITAADGSYSMTCALNGTYNIVAVRSPTQAASDTATGSSRIVASSNGTVTGATTFGIAPSASQTDYGSAPAAYGAAATASHGIVPGLYLGAGVDGENANGPDTNDGVFFTTGLHPGATETVVVLATQPSVSRGYLNAWMDFNGDGDWSDSGEQIFTNVRLNDGQNNLTFPVPAGAKSGTTQARFRWGFSKNQTVSGHSFAGEVEDYQVTLPSGGNTGVRAVADAATVDEDSTANSINVLANDVAGLIGGISITGAGPNSTQGGTVTVSNGQVLYTPKGNFAGTDTFTYTIRDTVGITSTGTVTVTVRDINDPPTANDDTFMVGARTSRNDLNVLANDGFAPDLNETLAIMSFSATSTLGGTITRTATGLNYAPPTNVTTGTDTFTYTVEDNRGGIDNATVTIQIVRLDPLVRLSLITTDFNGTTITKVRTDEEYQLRLFVEDLRTPAIGVFGAYLDVTYDRTDLTAITGAITYNDEVYSQGKSGMTSAGLINELGALRNDALATQPTGGGAILVAQIPFRATAVGTVVYSGNPADVLPLHDTVLYLSTQNPVDPALIEYVGTTLQIIDVGAKSDTFTVVEDSTGNVLNVLANDDVPAVLLPVTITGVGPTSKGGTAMANAARDRILYTPAGNFFGIETFSYTTTDNLGGLSVATVTVTVNNLNDDPTANADMVTVDVNSTGTDLDVLSNDTFLPDPAEILTIVAVQSPTLNSGTVTIVPGGRMVRYVPMTDFQGTDTFTYTISDGHGGVSTATVTVDVQVSTVPRVRYSFQTTDLAGNPITSVASGSQFLVSVYVQDVRSMPQGVFSPFLDLTYTGTGSATLPGGVASFDYNDGQGSPDLFPTDHPAGIYGAGSVPNIATAGLIDELGGVDGTALPAGVDPASPVLVVTIPFTAGSAGELTFNGDPADLLPDHEIVLFGDNTPVPASAIAFVPTTITVTAASPAPVTANSQFDVDGNGRLSPTDVVMVVNAYRDQVARTTATLRANGPKYDFNGDGALTPTDVVQIVNAYLSTVDPPQASLSASAAGGSARVAPISDVAEVHRAQRDVSATRPVPLGGSLGFPATDGSETGPDQPSQSTESSEATDKMPVHPGAIRSLEVAELVWSQLDQGSSPDQDDDNTAGDWERVLTDIADDIAMAWSS